MLQSLSRLRYALGSKMFQYVARRVARSLGFLDPITVMAKMRRFAQPSEVHEPLELLRAGAVFHARGLLNTRAIQHNLDWIWPYWVVRQFDPLSPSFIPRGFSLTHINLTHRNWTALGSPGCPAYPLVDPKGLVTPLFDGWSLDAWFIPEHDPPLFPSHTETSEQTYAIHNNVLQLNTRICRDDQILSGTAAVEIIDDIPVCMIQYRMESRRDGWLAVTLRPCNPEGISSIQDIRYEPTAARWIIDEAAVVGFTERPERHVMSNYDAGDVNLKLPDGPQTSRIHCPAGMATAAAMFHVHKNSPRSTAVQIPLNKDPEFPDHPPRQTWMFRTQWDDMLAQTPDLVIPDTRYTRLYRQSLISLILHSPADIYPGPFTYKRFWFRDAAFIGRALLAAGLSDRVLRCLDRYPERQKLSGFFHSQNGEWDANGEALWLIGEYFRFTGRTPMEEWLKAIRSGAAWIGKKRQETRHPPESPHAGLLPAGFSAEHLGLNDYYFWDDFWSIAGLRHAARMLEQLDDPGDSERCKRQADSLLKAVERSIGARAEQRRYTGIPASPYRRMDSGAVGSLVSVYPLQILSPEDARIRDTVDFLLKHCMVAGAFFQDNIHSGMNPYLTLHIAQVMMQMGNPGFVDRVEAVAGMASSTGQWPEAVHPGTFGGCMGDGHHSWASAEWFMMIRNMFVYEENNRLVLLKGIPDRWLEPGREIRFGPAPTHQGLLTVACLVQDKHARVRYTLETHDRPFALSIRLPGYKPVDISGEVTGEVMLSPTETSSRNP